MAETPHLLEFSQKMQQQWVRPSGGKPGAAGKRPFPHGLDPSLG